MFVYEFSPIDYWIGMENFKYFYCKVVLSKRMKIKDILAESLNSLAESKSYWEGDIRNDELHLGTFPNVENCGDAHYYIGLKQENNGTSYLIFPFEMPIYKDSLCSGDKVKNQYEDEIKNIIYRFCPIVADLVEVRNKLRYMGEWSHSMTEELMEIQQYLEGFEDLKPI